MTVDWLVSILITPKNASYLPSWVISGRRGTSIRTRHYLPEQGLICTCTLLNGDKQALDLMFLDMKSEKNTAD